jgi:hypothetical protein
VGRNASKTGLNFDGVAVPGLVGHLPGIIGEFHDQGDNVEKEYY